LVRHFEIVSFCRIFLFLASARVSKPEVRTKNIESSKINRFNKTFFSGKYSYFATTGYPYVPIVYFGSTGKQTVCNAA